MLSRGKAGNLGVLEGKWRSVQERGSVEQCPANRAEIEDCEESWDCRAQSPEFL